MYYVQIEVKMLYTDVYVEDQYDVKILDPVFFKTEDEAKIYVENEITKIKPETFRKFSYERCEIIDTEYKINKVKLFNK